MLASQTADGRLPLKCDHYREAHAAWNNFASGSCSLSYIIYICNIDKKAQRWRSYQNRCILESGKEYVINLSPMLTPTRTTTMDCARYPQVMMDTLGLSIFTRSSHVQSQAIFLSLAVVQMRCNDKEKGFVLKMQAEVHALVSPCEKTFIKSLQTSRPSSKSYASQLREYAVSYKVQSSQMLLERLQSSSVPAVTIVITSHISKHTLVRQVIRSRRIFCPLIFVRVAAPMFVLASRP